MGPVRLHLFLQLVHHGLFLGKDYVNLCKAFGRVNDFLNASPSCPWSHGESLSLEILFWVMVNVLGMRHVEATWRQTYEAMESV